MSRRPRVMVLAGVAAAGLAVAFWLPARADSASASENGMHSSGSGQHHNWPGFGRHGNRNDQPSGSASVPDPSAPGSSSPSSGPSPTSPAPSISSAAPSDSPSSAPSDSPSTVPPSSSVPTTAPPTSAAPSAPAVAAWAPFTNYAAGDVVSFGGKDYEVLAAHTSLPGWEPPTLPALFKLLG